MKLLSYLICFSIFSLNALAFDDFDILKKPTSAPQSIFSDKYNNRLNISSFKGQVVILNFWATWCKPCIVEMPSLNALQKKYKKSLKVIPLISQNESVSKVRTFLRRYKLNELEYFKDFQDFTTASYKVSGIPVSFIFDKQGQLVAKVDGSINWMYKKNTQYIEKLIAQ